MWDQEKSSSGPFCSRLDRLIDRLIQSASEMLLLKRAVGVLHIVVSAPPHAFAGCASC